MKLIDSHCHLDGEGFAGDLEETVARARSAGVYRFLAIGTGQGPPDLEAGLRLAKRFPDFVASAGVHPHDAAKATAETFAELKELVQHPQIVALGEIGLDFHYDFSPRDTQRRVFEKQLEIAIQSDVPVIIHTREAWQETLEVLRDFYASRAGIFHCFTGTAAEAEEALSLGFHVAFGGVLTFPKSDAVREAARLVPDDRLLVETDSPYLAPAPYRGKRNEPAFLVETVRKLAEVRGTDPTVIAEITTGNFERLFPSAASGYTGESP